MTKAPCAEFEMGPLTLTTPRPLKFKRLNPSHLFARGFGRYHSSIQRTTVRTIIGHLRQFFRHNFRSGGHCSYRCVVLIISWIHGYMPKGIVACCFMEHSVGSVYSITRESKHGKANTDMMDGCYRDLYDIKGNAQRQREIVLGCMEREVSPS
jgi:hypothetical protein